LICIGCGVHHIISVMVDFLRPPYQQCENASKLGSLDMFLEWHCSTWIDFCRHHSRLILVGYTRFLELVDSGTKSRTLSTECNSYLGSGWCLRLQLITYLFQFMGWCLLDYLIYFWQVRNQPAVYHDFGRPPCRQLPKQVMQMHTGFETKQRPQKGLQMGWLQRPASLAYTDSQDYWYIYYYIYYKCSV